MASPSDVVITGTGMLTHFGRGDATLSAVKNGVGKAFSVYADAVESGCRCTHAGLVADDVIADDALGITRKEGRFMGRAARFALLAAREALRDAGLEHDRDFAVIVGSGAGDTAAHIETQERLSGGARRVKPTVVPRLMSSTVSANLVHSLASRGPSASVAAACAGGAYNVILAAQFVRDGLATAALAGGCESIDPHFHAGFDRMRAYCADVDGTPLTMSRPYAADRAGFVFGEGAGLLVLERRDRAEARGASIVGVLLGWGASSDGNGEMVQPSADGAARSMRSALTACGLEPPDVSYVNTHATSTPAGDVTEVRALRDVFVDGVPYSSTKGFTGHMVSAAGSVEAILTARLLGQGLAPGCLNATPADPELLDYAPLLETTAIAGRVALSNSFGFGGTNATLVLGAP